MRYLRRETVLFDDGKIIIPECISRISSFSEGEGQRIFVETKDSSITITASLAHANAVIGNMNTLIIPQEILRRANMANAKIVTLYLFNQDTIMVFPCHGSTQDEQAMQKFHRPGTEDGYFIIENKYEILKVRFSDIFYFEKIKRTHNTCVVFSGGVSTFKSDLQEVLSRLDNDFMQCHKAFICNMASIRRIEKRQTYYVLHFDDAHSCPCSMFYGRAVLDWKR